MPRMSYVKIPMPQKPEILFLTAEEAWFWYIRTEKARRLGPKLVRSESLETRPCEPDDIYRFVMALHGQGQVGDEHLRVLGRYGWRESPPDPRERNEQRAWHLWDEALDKLETILVSRHIMHKKEHGYHGCA